MRKILKYILELFKESYFVVFLICFGISSVLLVLTKFSKTYLDTIDIDVKVYNVPQDKIITSNKHLKLKVNVEASGFAFFYYSFQNKTLKIDFQNELSTSKRESIYNIDYGKVQDYFGKHFEINRIVTPSLVYNFAKVSSKKVPVKVKETINFSMGYEIINSIKVKPDSITLFGTENSLGTINYIETSIVQLDKVKETINTDIELNLGNLPSDLKYSTNKVNVFAEVEKFTEKEILLPVEIINAPKDLNYNFFPKKIAIKVFIPLKEFNSLNTSDYKLICDFSQYKGGAQSTLFAELINKPSYVKTFRVMDNKLEFIFLE